MAQAVLTPNIPSEEKDEICLHPVITQADIIVSFDRFSSFTRLRRVTAWLIRFARLTRKAWHVLEVLLLSLNCEIGSLKIRVASQACSREQNSRQAYDSQHPLIIHECAPHFGRLWEAAVKSMKKHLSLVVSEAMILLCLFVCFAMQDEENERSEILQILEDFWPHAKEVYYT